MRTPLLSLALAAGAAAQGAVYTDANTGISFMGYTSSDGTNVTFGMALPQTVGTDLIGQIVAPTNGSGYAGVSLGGAMVNRLLVVAWPNGSGVTASLREATGYTAPPVYTNASISLAPIAKGTFTNSTHISYTFLCKGCITGDAQTFASTTTSGVFGYALSSTAVSDATSSSATLQYHDLGFGNFGLDLTSAQSADYATWAAMATSMAGGNSTTPGNATTGGNSTCSATQSNTKVSIANVTYDYIVAGAGPAGVIVAERLAETGKSVLLLERGQASTYATGGRSLVSWNDTVTQYDAPSMSYYLTSAADTSEYCTDTASQAGCILGGGTMVNALMFVRPQEVDFNDKWPVGWKWNDVAGAAQRLYERNPGTTLASENGQRYDQGTFNVFSKFLDNLGWSHVDAIEEPNSKHNVYSYPPWDIQDGMRAGPLKSYLPLAKAKSNFVLQLNTKVIRAVRNGTAVSGVEVETAAGRQIIKINAGGRVILASGTMSTPRVLFNSGIGPADQISTVANGCTGVTLPAQSDWINLPVGAGIKDHPIFTLTFSAKNSSNLTSYSQATYFSPDSTDVDLFAQGSGVLAQSGQRLVFWTSRQVGNETKYFQGTAAPTSGAGLKVKLYITHGLTSQGTLAIDTNGNTLFSKQPYMNTETDRTGVANMIDEIVAAVKNSTTLTYTMNSTGADLVASQSWITGSHYVGTAVMGPTNDGSAVVDLDGKVYGTDNLFVVDASIHPDLPTGNTQAIVMVVAENVAARIVALQSNTTTVAATSSFAIDPVATATGAATKVPSANSTIIMPTLTASITGAPAATTVSPALSSVLAPLVSRISNLTTALPSGIMTSALPTVVPTAVPGGPAAPTKGMPEGTTMKDLLEWIAYLLKGLMGGEERRNHPRHLSRH